MSGIAAESPKGFIKGIMSFETRKQWESMYEDGFVVEAIDIGEKRSAILLDGQEERSTTPTKKVEDDRVTSPFNAPSLPTTAKPAANLARKTDDVLTFLQTVDLAGIPAGIFYQ